MDRINKFLRKLSPKEREIVDTVVSKILAHNFYGLNIKKLKGKDREFRVRKGNVRIIFIIDNGDTRIISIERKSDNTYK